MRRGALPVKIHPPLLNLKPLNHSSHMLGTHDLPAKTASEDLSSWNKPQPPAFAEQAEHMQHPDLQKPWEGCSQLFWGMVEAAAGPRVQSRQAEQRREQPVWIWRWKELQEEKILSLDLMHTHGMGG